MDFFGWEDLDGDGHVDEVESLLADDLMCTNDEEREMNAGIGGLGPTSGSFGLESGLDGDVDEEFHDGLEIDLLNADIDPDDFRLMDEEERLEALDDAGLDPDDYDDSDTGYRTWIYQAGNKDGTDGFLYSTHCSNDCFSGCILLHEAVHGECTSVIFD